MHLHQLRILKFHFLMVYGFVLLASSEVLAVDPPINFEKQVAPILTQHCIACHQPGKTEGGPDLSNLKAALKGGESGAAFEMGEAAESELLTRVKPESPGMKPDMPRQGEPLNASQVAILAQWIDQGAKWPDTIVLKEKSKADAATWWSLQKLTDAKVPPLPSGFPSDWNQNPIDHFVSSKLHQENLSGSPPADRRSLLRRLSYDLTGLPPSPEEMQFFLQDTRPDAYERQVNRLLASPAYGERWGRYWLDITRFGESNGFERNVLIDNSWPFRDYVIRSLNQDKPFDQLVREHIAGDTVAPDRPYDMLGVAFLTVGPFDDVGNQDPVQAAQIRANAIDDTVVATSSAFLGLTVGCARCHDHKFDPIQQADYYRLQSIFNGTRQGSRSLATASQLEVRARHLKPLEAERGKITASLAAIEKAFQERIAQELKNRPVKITKPLVTPSGIEEKLPEKPISQIRLTIYNSNQNPDSAGGVRIQELEIFSKSPNATNVALAAKIDAASRKPGDFGDAYSPQLMIDGKFGAAWISPIGQPVITLTLDKPQIVDKLIFSTDKTSSIKGSNGYNQTVGDYILEVSPDGQKWELVADSSRERPAPSEAHEQARRRRLGYNPAESAEKLRLNSEIAKIDQRIAAIPNYPSVWAGSFAQPPANTYLQVGGDPQRKGPEIAPGSLSYLKLTAPIFNLPADAPESQRRKALAEWIASPENALTWRVLANRIWHLHFGTGLVDTPSDFGYMGGRPSHPELLDWLARRLIEHGGRWKPLHRDIVLSQTYRQSSSANSKALAQDAQSRLLWRYPPRRLEGEQIRDSMMLVAGVLNETRGGPGFRLYQYLQDNVSTYISLDDPGPETWRRTIYHQSPRAAKVDYLSDFDCPDNAFSAPSRSITTTPLQSMTQWNHRFTMRMAEKLIERVKPITDPKARVAELFEIVLQRAPTEQESQESAGLAATAGWENLARVLINCNEFLYLE